MLRIATIAILASACFLGFAEFKTADAQCYSGYRSYQSYDRSHYRRGPVYRHHRHYRQHRHYRRHHYRPRYYAPRYDRSYRYRRSCY